MDLDLALVFDPGTRQCDFAFDGRDLVFDATPATALLISTGSDARALPGDDLPDLPQPFNAPTNLASRGGWCGDALDRLGRTIGSRCWVYRRSKQSEQTRRGYAQALADSLAWRYSQLGRVVSIAVAWVRADTLGAAINDGDARINLAVQVG